MKKVRLSVRDLFIDECHESSSNLSYVPLKKESVESFLHEAQCVMWITQSNKNIVSGKTLLLNLFFQYSTTTTTMKQP